MKSILLVLVAFISLPGHTQRIPLNGEWRFAMDTADKGIAQKWFNIRLKENVHLPGSMAVNGKGENVSLSTRWTGSIYDSSFFFQPRLAKYRQPGNIKIPFWLTPVKHYVGVAWYQKDITVPSAWTHRSVRLFLERTHIATEVWIDDRKAGPAQNSLSAPHVYDLTGWIRPGRHRITIRVDNRISEMNVGPDAHSVSDHTQSNWNGIIGQLYLEAAPLTAVEQIQVFPDLENQLARIQVSIRNQSIRAYSGTLNVSAESLNTPVRQRIAPVPVRFTAPGGRSSTVSVTLHMGKNMQTWDEFHPALYRLAVVMGKGLADRHYQEFGMREVKVKDKKILINGRAVFLRGDVNCCVFPLTGYPPTDVRSWERIWGRLKAYGMNHVRFHSWCPPDAAFTAADRLGLYLQVEAPTWPNHGTSLGDGRFIDEYIYEETKRMVSTYGNHPSFTMLAAGNEPAGRNQARYLAGFINYWKAKDDRRIYTGASVATSWPLVPENQYMVKSGARGLDWNNTRPESMSDYRKAVEAFPVPYVTHEQGQWCVFPDFREIGRYTGAFRARNYELFAADLKEQGMADEAEKFLMASGKLQVLCYKNEIEKSLRTPGLSGFQLLGLEDFPGQGTATVGVLNSFYEEKGYVKAKQFRRFCNATVPLMRTGRFVYRSNETFEADVELFHYGPSALKNAVIGWTIRDAKNRLLAGGHFAAATYETGTLSRVGHFAFALSGIKKAVRLNVEIKLEGTSFANNWPVWVYPAATSVAAPPGIYVTDTLDERATTLLENGGKVFLNAAGRVIKGREVVQYFTPVFWNTSWFKMRPPHTLGILVDSAHPAFYDFPTSDHSDLQWWEIVNRAQVMHLEDFPKTFRPLIQPIDTWFMNRRLALLFEVNVGRGRLMVCSADLQTDLDHRPAASQLLHSLQQYMLSDRFRPSTSVDLSIIKALFQQPSRFVFDSFTKDSPDELKPKAN